IRVDDLRSAFAGNLARSFKGHVKIGELAMRAELIQSGDLGLDLRQAAQAEGQDCVNRIVAVTLFKEIYFDPPGKELDQGVQNILSPVGEKLAVSIQSHLHKLPQINIYIISQKHLSNA